MSTPEPGKDLVKLSTQLERRGVDADTWNTLQNTIFPGAHPSSILMAVDYCKARKLDVLKKPVHIVPMPYKDENDQWKKRDVVMPGINEVRITAMRTGLYAGADKPEWGPPVGHLGVTAPEYCTYTVYRFNHNQKIPFPATVYFEEACGTTDYGKKLNAMWTRRPRGQLEKCAEAAALRKAFPEEVGNEHVPEEMQMLMDGAAETRIIEPGASRASAAADALKTKLGITNQAGTGALDMTLQDLGRIEESRKEPEPIEQAKGELPTQGAKVANRRDISEFRYTLETGVAALRECRTVADLASTFEAIQDDFDFSGRELPVDIDANYRDLKESFDTGQR